MARDSRQHDSGDLKAKDDRIAAIIADVAARRARGEPIADADVLAAHPDLAADLLPALNDLGKAEAAVAHADGADAETMAASYAGAPTGAISLAIAGYEIVREISRGGQGVVYQAIQETTKRKVAIKVLLEGSYASSATRKRFEREIELVAQLKHPNIISVLHSGTTSDGRQFCVMDYVRGEPLREYVREKKLPLEEALKLFSVVADAVQYAHQRGIIHRDLKPSNILVDADGRPRILDFGLAKWVSAPAETLVSMTQQVVGTLPYLSPEQARGNPDEIDTRTDVYALGVILYELMTGGYPYPVVGQMADVLKHIAETEPTPPSRRWKSDSGIASRTAKRLKTGQCPIDDEVQTIITRALAKERTRRYQSAGELARDVQRYLSGDPIEAKRDSALYMLRKQLHRHRGPAAAGMVIALLLATLAIAMSIQSARNARLARENLELADSERIAKEAAIAAQRQANERAEALRWRDYCNKIALIKDALAQGEIKRVKKLLSDCPEDLRRFEWCALVQMADRSALGIESGELDGRAVFSADGRHILMASSRQIRSWDVQSGEESGVVPAKTIDSGRLAVFSRDRSVLVTCEVERKQATSSPSQSGEEDARTRKFTNLLHVIETETGKERLRISFSSASRAAISLALSDDGTTVGVIDLRNVRLWDTKTGRSRATFPAKRIFMAISPNGSQVAVREGIFDADTGDRICTLEGEEGEPVAYSRDGRRVAGIARARVLVWDASTGKLYHRFDAQADYATDVNFSPDGSRVVAGMSDRTVRMWDIENRRESALYRGHVMEVNSVCFSPDGDTVVSSDREGGIRIWDTMSRQLGFEVPRWGRLDKVDFDRTGKRLALTGKNIVCIYDALTGRPLRTLRATGRHFCCARFSDDGERICCGARDAGIVTWNITSGEIVESIPGTNHENYPDAYFSGDLSVSLSGGPGAKTARETRTQRVLWETGHTFAAFAPDGNWVAISRREGSVETRDTRTGELRALYSCGDLVFGPPVISPEGSLLASLGRKPGERQASNCVVWDVASKEVTASVALLATQLMDSSESLSFSPDGSRLLIFRYSGTLDIIDPRRGELIISIPGVAPQGWVTLSAAPAATNLALGSLSKTFLFESHAVSNEIRRERAKVALANEKARPLLRRLSKEHKSATSLIAELERDPSIPPAMRDLAVRLAEQRPDDQVDARPTSKRFEEE